MSDTHIETTFEALGLSAPILAALGDAGYEAPTPIQAQTIPALLAGRDVVGQAQTGTGKTAAFALPLLERLDPAAARVQGLVLVPTRELALQVAEAVHAYARRMPGVSVLPIYGGAAFPPQLRHLRRGVHVVVGTPGRILDHLERESLDLGAVRMVVLDEADEMLRMGFAEDVDAILSRTPPGRQTALFTATMPPRIRAIAEGHLHDPVSVSLATRTLTVPAVEQRYLNVSESQKVDALTRVLGAEDSEAVLVFARTKNGAAELTEKLVARGWAAEALHGDMSQAQRETLIKRFRSRQAEVVVATDVAARGLDVEHITHVINFDAPNDLESYVHRIGRTGRAGRAGVAILFVTPRQRGMMREIERFTGQRLEPMRVPTQADVAARTIEQFKQAVRRSLEEAVSLDVYVSLAEELAVEQGIDMAEVAAAIARIALAGKVVEGGAAPEPEWAPRAPSERRDRGDWAERGERGREREARPAERRDRGEARPGDRGRDPMVRLQLSLGATVGVRPSDVVGAIANEAGVPGSRIGAIEVRERSTFVDVPRELAQQVLGRMARASLRGRPVHVRMAWSPEEQEEHRRQDRAPDRSEEAPPAPAPPPAPATATAEPQPAARPPAAERPRPTSRSTGFEPPRRKGAAPPAEAPPQGADAEPPRVKKPRWKKSRG